MDVNLAVHEARVIGTLIEKEITTPDQYPLSLNAITSGCNQKSNREPVLELDEGTVQQTLDDLTRKHLVSEKTAYSSRVPKYKHRFCNTEFGPLKFPEQALGIICVLLLRGPQTPGELRTRTNRLCRFSDVHEVEATLRDLMERDDGPFVAMLPREAGKRESRYVHLFSGEGQVQEQSVSEGMSADLQTSESERVDQLAQLVSDLRQEVAQLRERLERLETTAVSSTADL